MVTFAKLPDDVLKEIEDLNLSPIEKDLMWDLVGRPTGFYLSAEHERREHELFRMRFNQWKMQREAKARAIETDQQAESKSVSRDDSSLSVERAPSPTPPIMFEKGTAPKRSKVAEKLSALSSCFSACFGCRKQKEKTPTEPESPRAKL